MFCNARFFFNKFDVNCKKIMTRQTIQNEAVQLFYKVGYGSASMRDIAAKAHIEAASIYNHFSSKQDLLHTICQTTLGELVKGLDENIALRRNAIAQLEVFMEYYLRYQEENWLALSVCFNEGKHLESSYSKSYRKLRKDFEAKLLDLVTKGISSKKLGKRDPELITQTLISALTMRPNASGKMNINMGAYAQEIIRLLFEGLLKR